MLGSVLRKIVSGFNFKPGEWLIIFILLSSVGAGWYGNFKTEEKIEILTEKVMEIDQKADQRHQEGIEKENRVLEEKGSAVLSTLLKNDILRPDDILTFLSQKPAGKMDLKLAVNNDEVFRSLVERYGDLAKNARAALQ